MKKNQLFLAILLMIQFVAYAQTPNNRNVLIEDLTSTICGHCPCFDTLLEDVVLTQHPGSVIIAIHSSMSAYASLYSDSLSEQLLYHSSPSAVINRQGVDLEPLPVVDTVNAIYNRSPLAPVRLIVGNKEYSETSRQLTFDVTAEAVAPLPDADYRLHVLVVENKLVGYQQHFPECPGGDNYEHNNVLRLMAYPISGKHIHQGVWETGTTVTQSLNLTLDAAWVPQNCDIIVFAAEHNPLLYLAKVHQVIREKATGPIGTPEANSPMIVSVHPNPAKDIVNIHLNFTNRQKAAIGLFNSTGQQVVSLADRYFPAGVSNFQFTLPQLTKGMYFIRVASGSETVDRKITIIQ